MLICSCEICFWAKIKTPAIQRHNLNTHFEMKGSPCIHVVFLFSRQMLHQKHTLWIRNRCIIPCFDLKPMFSKSYQHYKNGNKKYICNLLVFNTIDKIKILRKWYNFFWGGGEIFILFYPSFIIIQLDKQIFHKSHIKYIMYSSVSH